jgi:hypothetical protein
VQNALSSEDETGNTVQKKADHEGQPVGEFKRNIFALRIGFRALAAKRGIQGKDDDEARRYESHCGGLSA